MVHVFLPSGSSGVSSPSRPALSIYTSADIVGDRVESSLSVSTQQPKEVTYGIREWEWVTAGEMVASVEDQGSVPSPHVAVHTICDSSSGGSLQALGHTYAYMQVKHIYT